MANEKRLIDANAVLDLFTAQAPSMSYNKLFMTVANAPTVDAVEVVHGRWRWCGSDRWNDAYQCSNCCKIAMNDSNYCPNCGADMRERKDNDND